MIDDRQVDKQIDKLMLFLAVVIRKSVREKKVINQAPKVKNNKNNLKLIKKVLRK